MRAFACALGLALLAITGCQGPTADESADTVVLVHGLGRTSNSLAPVALRLRSVGYDVIDFDYPSNSEPMERLVELLAAEVDSCCGASSGAVHFVTHSMGGVLVRSYLGEGSPPRGGRVVMLSPPNQGSEIIDVFGPSPLLVSLLGPAGARLGTDSTDVPRQLGPVGYPVGVIAGEGSLSRLGSWLIPGPDDGLVGVEATRVEGMTGFMVVPASHTFLMNRPDVLNAVETFLAEGHFAGSR